MVLDGATTSDSFPSSDNVPSSNFDPYESGGRDSPSLPGNLLRIQQASPNGDSLTEPIFINLNELPRRWSVLGAGPPPDFVTKGIRAQCTFVANTLQRPITQDEANALAFHFAKSLRMASYGAPVGVAVAMGIAYRGNSHYRFPFWTPIKEGGRFSKDVFGPFRNFQARVAWQSSRLGAYALVGTTLGQLFFGSYALTVSLAGRAMDPRLRDFNEALKQKQRSGLGKEGGRRVEDESAGPRGMETYDMARQRRGAQDISRRGRQPSAAVADDASPTGGAFSDDFTGAAEPGFMNEQEVRQKTDAQMSSSRDRSSPSASGQTSNSSSSQTARASRESSPPRTGSSWDRLRQGAMSSEPGGSSRGTASSASAGSGASAQASGNDALGDSFSFSSSDGDRELAKTEAQSEFDARLERERAGKNFNDGGGGRRW